MAKVGYARVSSKDQDLAIQIEALEKAGCTKIFSEKVTGTSKQKRKQLAICLEYLREGDVLVVTRIDRLARSVRDLQNIIHQFKEGGIDLQATEQPIDTSTPAGKAFLDMLGVFAEFETNLRAERQREGIAKAKALGKYKGRKNNIALQKTEQIMSLVALNTAKIKIAEQLGISISSVYRIIREKTE